MESWSSRGSSIFSMTSTVVGLTALAIALSSFFLAAVPGDVDVNFSVNQVYRLDKLKNTINERAIVSFNIDTDFSPLLHWNVKQVYVYVLAEYESKKYPVIRQIVFNQILQRFDEEKHKFLVKGTNIVADFPIDDVGQHLKGKEVKLTLCWEIVPYVGLIYRQIGSKSVQFTLPEEYINDKKVPKTDPVNSDWKHEYVGYGSTMYDYYGK